MKAAIAAGATGGHVFPAVAVGQELCRLRPDTRLLFVGREAGSERDRLGTNGSDYLGLRVRGLGPRPRWKSVLAMWETLAAEEKCHANFRREKPDVVLGFGGYVAAPVMLAAQRLRIPTALHEANVVPGKVNRWLAPYIDQVFLSFGEAERSFRCRRLEVVGMPVRREAIGKSADHRCFGLQPGVFTILIFAGSQGARSLCRAGAEAIEILEERGLEFQVLFQTGHSNEAETRAGIERDNVSVVPFIEEMGKAYACADLVVARAGAGSIAEVAHNARPAILVPYPHAAGHQERNARILCQAGAARMILDGDLDGRALAQEIGSLIRDPRSRSEMAEAVARFAHPRAAQRIAEGLIRLADRSSTEGPKDRASTRKSNGKTRA